MLVLGSVKKWRFVFFRKTRKLDILGGVCPKFQPKWSKMPKIEGFPHFFKNHTLDFPDFWSLDQLVVETLGVAFVRPSIRSSVTLFLGNRSLLFYETLQLVRACRCKKNVPSAFLKIFTVLAILAKNCPKWPFLA